MTTKTLPILLAALIVLPSASAVGSHAARGHLSSEEGAWVRGALDVRGEGILELPTPAGARVGFAGLSGGWIVDRSRDVTPLGLSAPLDSVAVNGFQEANESISPRAESGAVEDVRCGPACLVALFATPGGGTLEARGFADDALAPTHEARKVSTSQVGQGERFTYELPVGTLAFASDGGTRLRDAQLEASGKVGLVVRDATLALVVGGERRTLDLRSADETTTDAAGRAVVVRHHTRYVVLLLDGATLHIPAGAPFRLSYPREAEARLDGAYSANDATGALAIGARRFALDRDPVRLEGVVTLRLANADADVDGRVQRAFVRGADVVPLVPPEAEAAGGGLFALAALALLGRFLALPLYHRLGPSDVLANANRFRIYELVRERPGVGVGDIVARLGLSRVLVRHHLRMLEAHRLVRVTRWRRRRTYAVAGETTGPATAELKDPTRRRVAAAIVASAGGATQKDLAAALGLSQRLVSYHVGRLERVGAVRAEGRNPRSYVATPSLVEALAHEESEKEAAVPMKATAA